MCWEVCLGFHLEVWSAGESKTRREEEVGQEAHPRTLGFSAEQTWAETGAGQRTIVIQDLETASPAHSEQRECKTAQASLVLLHFAHGSFICSKPNKA